MKRLKTLLLGLVLISSPVWGEDWPSFRGSPSMTGSRIKETPQPLKLLWKVPAPKGIESTPAIAGGVVYLGSGDKHTYAYDLQTGKEIWKAETGVVISSTTVEGGRVYVGNIDGFVFCLDAKTGSKIWTFETGSQITGGVNIAGNVLLVGSHDETLYGLNRDGKKLWEFRSNGGPVNGVPTVNDGKTFLAGCDNNLHVLNVNDGKEIAQMDLGGPSGSTAAIDGDFLVVGTMNNEVVAVNLKEMKILWRYAAPKRAQAFYSSASITNDLVIIGSRDRKVHAISRKTGKEVWTFLTEGRVDTSPVIIGDRVYVGSADKTFYCLNRDTGAELERHELDGSISGSPAYADGTLVLGTEKGTIYAWSVGKK